MSRLLLSVALVVASASAAGAQTLSPPLVEYQGRGRASFQVSNPTLYPLTVVLQPRGFVVDERGILTDVPLDTSRIKLKLSAMSVRLAPRQTYNVFYEVATDSAPAWFAVMAIFSGGRTQNGLAVRVELPHVVYLNQREPLARRDLRIEAFRYDTAAKVVWLKVVNQGPALGRVRGVYVTGSNGRSAEGGGLPIFPRASRWVNLAWRHMGAPQRAALQFDGFRLETDTPPSPGQP